MVEVAEVEDTNAEVADQVQEMPEWLNEPQYSEILTDDSSKNILSRYKERDEAIKALVEKEKVVRSGFKMPEKLTDEHMKELRPVIDKMMEVPEKPEGYEMARPGEIGEDLDLSEQTKMELRAVAKQHGIGQKGFQAMYETALRAISRSAKETQAEIDEIHKTEKRNTIAEMQKYWGPQEYLKLAGDSSNKAPGLIDQYVRTRAIDDAEFADLKETLQATGVSNHPLLFKVMGDAARMWNILEGQSTEPGQYAPTRGNVRLTEEKLRVAMYPNTPASLGGGKPG